MKKNIGSKIVKKSKDFLSQIPSWELAYKKNNKSDITFNKNEWTSAPAKFTDKDLTIFGYAVMEDWEHPYMKALADIAAKGGGKVLELGFGMGISAEYIQAHPVIEHIIIEANHEVAERAREFAKKAPHSTTILEGFWEQVIDQIPDNSLDGILFDTYPLSDLELYQNHFFFFPYAFKKLKKGGIFTYYSDEIKSFGRVHLKKLLKAGFTQENIQGSAVAVNPPENCEYWKAKTMLAPVVKK